MTKEQKLAIGLNLQEIAMAVDEYNYGKIKPMLNKIEHTVKETGSWVVWTFDDKAYAKCSTCGYGDEGELFYKEGTCYCPVCGTDMRDERGFIQYTKEE